MKGIEDEKMHVDFADVAVMVHFLNEQGIWVHSHVNPIYLEMEIDI